MKPPVGPAAPPKRRAAPGAVAPSGSPTSTTWAERALVNLNFAATDPVVAAAAVVAVPNFTG
jgi:hypothetical protein